MTEKFLYPNHPVRCIITRQSECGKSVFFRNLILIINNKYNKIYIYPPRLHQDLYQNIFKCFSNYIPVHIIPIDLNEEDDDIVFVEILHVEDFEKFDSEIETYEEIEELKYPQENDDGGIIILYDINEKEMNDPRVQARFTRLGQNNISIIINSQDYYELPKETIRANGNTNHILKPNNFRDVLNIYQDKNSMDMTFNKFKVLTST